MTSFRLEPKDPTKSWPKSIAIALVAIVVMFGTGTAAKVHLLAWVTSDGDGQAERAPKECGYFMVAPEDQCNARGEHPSESTIVKTPCIDGYGENASGKCVPATPCSYDEKGMYLDPEACARSRE